MQGELDSRGAIYIALHGKFFQPFIEFPSAAKGDHK